MRYLRIRLNSRTLSTSTKLLANGLTLAGNTYLFGRTLLQSHRQRRQDRRLEQLQNAAEIATASARMVDTLTRVWRQHHGAP